MQPRVTKQVLIEGLPRSDGPKGMWWGWGEYLIIEVEVLTSFVDNTIPWEGGPLYLRKLAEHEPVW